MLHKIIELKDYLFWSKNIEDQIVIGGNVKGISYGKVSFVIEEEKVTLLIEVPTQLIEKDYNDSPIVFLKNELEFNIILDLIEEYNVKLSKNEIINHHKRENLIINTLSLFK